MGNGEEHVGQWFIGRRRVFLVNRMDTDEDRVWVTGMEPRPGHDELREFDRLGLRGFLRGLRKKDYLCVSEAEAICSME